MRSAFVILSTMALMAPAIGQEPPTAAPVPTADELLARFDRLDATAASTVVRAVERHLQRLDDPVVQGILGMERGLQSYPARPRPTWFPEAVYAPVAAKRHLIAAGTAAHDRATRSMRPIEFLPDLHGAVVFDWQTGKAVRADAAPTDRQRFANLANGYPPGTDHAVARLLERLDTDADQRPLGRYFAQLYADRDGGVYEGVSLFAAWHAGVVVEMPDTDAIAYAREVLDTRSFVAPLPADRRRERLYRKVHEGFERHREYRSLRLAAAAAFVAAEPRIEDTYRPLVQRCHWLWVQTGGDLEAFAAELARAGSRSRFVLEIDQAIRATPEVVEGRVALLRNVAEYLRALADRELAAAGV